MNCVETRDVMTGDPAAHTRGERASAVKHLNGCGDCRLAVKAWHDLFPVPRKIRRQWCRLSDEDILDPEFREVVLGGKGLGEEVGL